MFSLTNAAYISQGWQLDDLFYNYTHLHIYTFTHDILPNQYIFQLKLMYFVKVVQQVDRNGKHKLDFQYCSSNTDYDGPP